MIYIVEIPHQRQPFCWSAHNEADAVVKIFRTYIRAGDMPDTDAPFAEWVEYNGHDLNSQHVFMDAASAIDGLKEISGHGAVEAIAALREELEATGELPVEKNEKDWQQKCLDVGFQYWRGPDAHGVTCTKEQAVELLQDLLGVEVEIE